MCRGLARTVRMVEKGDMAPGFSLPADDGSMVSLEEFRGKKVILYFYPKDNTSGCTTQACDLRDMLPRIDERGAVVLGVSPDSLASHEKFRDKFQLNFPLLSDPDHQVPSRDADDPLGGGRHGVVSVRVPRDPVPGRQGREGAGGVAESETQGSRGEGSRAPGRRRIRSRAAHSHENGLGGTRLPAR